MTDKFQEISKKPRWVQRVVANIQRLWTVYVREGWVLQRSLKEFYLVLGGHIYFQTVAAAVRFDLFSLLAGGKILTAEELRKAMGIEDQPCRILLLGLTSLGLLIKKGESYANSRITELFLTRQSPRSMTNIVLWQHHINYRALSFFFEALKENRNVGLKEFPGSEPTLYQRLAQDPFREQIFQDAMEQISRQATDLLARYVDFRSVRHLVDVGGGNGTNILHIARENPHLKADVFDSETVCALARDNIRAHGLAGRLGAVTGDCFKDPFPTGADAILFCHFFTIWSKQRNLELLKKAFRALPEGGRVLIFNMMQDDDGKGPLTAAMGSPYFLTLATGEGMLYRWSDYEQLFLEAGFTDLERLRLPKDHGVMTGYKRTR
jgi:SAM-dependent methyltransferase